MDPHYDPDAVRRAADAIRKLDRERDERAYAQTTKSGCGVLLIAAVLVIGGKRRCARRST